MMTLSGVLLTQENDAAPTLQDMATGLSRIPRFGGQTLQPWSVAQHLLACAAYTRRQYPGDRQLELHVLLHDAHESMTSDIPTSWKTSDMRALQKRLDVRIYRSLVLAPPRPWEVETIAMIDRDLLLAEASLVTPPATCQRICEEVGDGVRVEARAAVREVLEAAKDGAEAADLWRLRVVQLLRVV
jgi:hypothetical protein